MNNELEQIQKREDALKKILIEAKGCIDKAEILNDSNTKRLNEIKDKLISKGVDIVNLKQEIIDNIEDSNQKLNNIYNSISFKMLSYYKKVDLKICDEYLKLDESFNKLKYENYDETQLKIDLLKKKLNIVELGLEQSKTVRDTAIGKEEHLKSRKLDIENKIIEKGIEPKNIEQEILKRKNELDLLQDNIYQDLSIILNVFEEQNIISKEYIHEWNKIKINLFNNKEVIGNE